MTPSARHSVPPLPRRRVCEWYLRDAFNASGLYEQAGSGQIQVQVVEEAVAPPASREPRGTLSQRLLYRRGGEVVAMVHQYRRPDGTLGGSGRPDPKWLRVEQDALIPFPDPGRTCDYCVQRLSRSPAAGSE